MMERAALHEAYCHGSAGPVTPDHSAVGVVVVDANGHEVRRAAKYLGHRIEVRHIGAPGSQQVADLAAVLFAVDVAPDNGALTICVSSGFVATLMQGKLQPYAFRDLTDVVRAAVAQRGAQVRQGWHTDPRMATAKQLAEGELSQRGVLFGKPAGGWLG
jgi:hypothetical protein